MPSYLQKRVNRWYAVLEIPKHLRPIFKNKPRFIQSLETESRRTAERRKLPVIADWKTRIELAKKKLETDLHNESISHLVSRDTSEEPDIPIHEDAAFWRKQLAKAKDADARSLILEQIEYVAWDIGSIYVDEVGQPPTQNKEAKQFFATATGQIVPFTEYMDEWLDTVRTTDKTKDMHRAAVHRFAEQFKTVQDVTRPDVRRWVTKLLNVEGLAVASVQRLLSPLRGYWRYLQSIEIAADEHEPFSKLEVSRRSTKGDPRTARLPFSPKDVVALHKEAKAKGDTSLADLIWQAMWTGCRIEELCALKTTDVHEDHFAVTDAKTSAGWRDVPIHSKLRKRMQQLVKSSTDGYVLSGLKENKYHDRSNAIGKRFGRLKKDAGFGSQHVFHSIRKTVITILENAGVAENIVADIVGHEKTTMTYGLYSGGIELSKKCSAIEHLTYGAAKTSR